MGSADLQVWAHGLWEMAPSADKAALVEAEAHSVISDFSPVPAPSNGVGGLGQGGALAVFPLTLGGIPNAWGDSNFSVPSSRLDHM